MTGVQRRCSMACAYPGSAAAQTEAAAALCAQRAAPALVTWLILDQSHSYCN